MSIAQLKPEAKVMELDTAQLLELTGKAVTSAEALLAAAKAGVRIKIQAAGGMEAAQHATHGLAWYATTVESLAQMHLWAERLRDEGALTRFEELLLIAAFGEYGAQLSGGVPMSQLEIIRPEALGISRADVRKYEDAVADLLEAGNDPALKAELAEIIKNAQGATTYGNSGLDEMMAGIQDQMRKFSDAEVVPHAHEWHLENAYIPTEIIDKVAELGVFGLTLPEDLGGLGLGKLSMCVVSEELSRGYIGVGSLGTRAEIAGELILHNGTQEQKEKYLPKIASGEILPTAVFTEPNTGSDLASLKTRAVKEGSTYKITGQKTWITHPVRADIMTVLARTNPDEKGYRGLSMFIAEKPRGTDENPFPADGMTGGEIEVLGYRGMKEYDISFDAYEVPEENLLGAAEGQGFKQLMNTFEGARIQTAARAVGVAQNAMDLALKYALERNQFGKPIYSFPRIANKVVMMAVETMVARQLTYFSARQKDDGKRCDLEAGMAKLLGARVAWANADNALQVHGGNGFALEYPVSRVLCDARILNIFEGAAEIQAQVIARRLLESEA